MHREVTTAYTQQHARALCKQGWRAMEARDQRKIEGRTLTLRPDNCGGLTDDFSARMTRTIRGPTLGDILAAALKETAPCAVKPTTTRITLVTATPASKSAKTRSAAAHSRAKPNSARTK